MVCFDFIKRYYFVPPWQKRAFRGIYNLWTSFNVFWSQPHVGSPILAKELLISLPRNCIVIFISNKNKCSSEGGKLRFSPFSRKSKLSLSFGSIRPAGKRKRGQNKNCSPSKMVCKIQKSDSHTNQTKTWPQEIINEHEPPKDRKIVLRFSCKMLNWRLCEVRRPAP